MMRAPSVIRWLLLAPSVLAAWEFAAIASAIFREIVVGRCFASDAPPPEYCEAPWFPRDFLADALLFLGVALSAVVVVSVAAVVAPSHKAHVGWVALGAGAILAIIIGYSTGAVAEVGVAIAAGALAALVVSRTAIASRHATLAATNVAPKG